MSKHGTVEYKNKELTIMQAPYLEHCIFGDGNMLSGDYYIAQAEDEDEQEYMIYWEVVDDLCEDESDACDWDVYAVKEI